MPKLDDSVCVFGAGIMLRHLQTLRSEVEGVRLAEDIECIHRMRVASRRLRAAQQLFDGFIPEKKAMHWEKAIRKVTRTLGAARDQDIQLQSVESFFQKYPDLHLQPGYRRLRLRLTQQRSHQQAAVANCLDELIRSPAIAAVETILQEWGSKVGQVYKFSPYLFLLAFQAITHELTDFLSYQEAVLQPENITELHAMRIAGKRLRYTLEIFAPIYPEELKKFIDAMKDIQELLGSIHDCDVWVQFLPEFLQEEAARISDFYGSLRGYYRLIPGINHFRENRQLERDRLYGKFLKTWNNLASKDHWNSLRNELQIPFPVISSSVKSDEKAGENENSPDQ